MMKTIDDLMSVTGWTLEAREARLQSVALNAVREARVAYGRDDKQWLDDDARRVNAIFELLHLVVLQDVDHAAEALALNIPEQPVTPAAIVAVEKALKADKIDLGIL